MPVVRIQLLILLLLLIEKQTKKCHFFHSNFAETTQNFEVFPADEFGNQIEEKPIFKSTEKSSCPQRMILP